MFLTNCNAALKLSEGAGQSLWTHAERINAKRVIIKFLTQAGSQKLKGTSTKATCGQNQESL